jgi:hypothetical protein
MDAFKLFAAILFFVLSSNQIFSQEEKSESSGHRMVSKEFKLHPVECGSGKVQVEIEFKNPFRESVTIYGSESRGVRVRFGGLRQTDNKKIPANP